MSLPYEPTPEAAAKLYAKQVGDHGHSGGWIHNRQGRPIVQGWAGYADRQRGLGVIVPKVMVDGTTRYAIVWSKGKPTGLGGGVACTMTACPKVLGGLKGVSA